MKTTIVILTMSAFFALATPARAKSYCNDIMSNQHDIFGHNNAFVSAPFPKGCKLTKGEQQTRKFCKTVPEGTRGRGCWAYGLH